MTDDGYLLADPAAARNAALAELFDPGTFRQLAATGIGPGRRCWEVGAGGATVPEWLAEQVGPDGLVVATDLDTSGLPAARSNLCVLRHDIGAEPPPETGLDLVHARLVLTHVPQRAAALAGMVAAVRPGGWAAGWWSRTPIRACSRCSARTSTARHRSWRTGSGAASAH